MNEREAKPFCSNPGCPCGEVGGTACEEYINHSERRGQERCFRCGWWEEDHR